MIKITNVVNLKANRELENKQTKNLYKRVCEINIIYDVITNLKLSIIYKPHLVWKVSCHIEIEVVTQ